MIRPPTIPSNAARFALAAALLLACAAPALADPSSTMTAAQTDVSTWVRAGGGLVFIGCAISMVRGWVGAIAFLPAMVGLAIGVDPTILMSWIT